MDLMLAAMLATLDPNADAWATVQWARDARRIYRGLVIGNCVSERDSRPVVDALPIDDSSPVWDVAA